MAVTRLAEPHARWPFGYHMQARVPAARPELIQADVDRWMADYDPEWDWQDDAASDAQLGYLRSLLQRDGLLLADGDAAHMTKGQASHMIDLLAGPDDGRL